MFELWKVGGDSRIRNAAQNQNKELLLLPDDLIIEILIRLPVQSLGRCKCVCKLWRSLIQDAKFTVKHLGRSEVVYVYEEDKNDEGDEETFRCVDEEDGVLVERGNLTGKLQIRNPVTKQVQNLPNPKGSGICIWLFPLPGTNYSNIKLVNVYGKEGTEDGGCQVLTVGAAAADDLAWRAIDCPRFHNLRGKGESSFKTIAIDRALYVCRYFDDVRFGVSEVVRFDVESEQLSHIKIPQAVFPNFKHVRCNAWEDKFCLVSLEGQLVHALVLEDFERQEWSERKVIIPLSLYGEFPGTLHTLSPRSLGYDCYWFARCDGAHLKYNIRTKRLERVYSPPPGKRLLYDFVPSLVSWKVNHPQEGPGKRKQYKKNSLVGRHHFGGK